MVVAGDADALPKLWEARCAKTVSIVSPRLDFHYGVLCNIRLSWYVSILLSMPAHFSAIPELKKLGQYYRECQILISAKFTVR